MWPFFGWAGMCDSSGGSGGGVTQDQLNAYVKKTELLSTTVTPPEGLFESNQKQPISKVLDTLTQRTEENKQPNPNLLYNSTGMMNMSGWVQDARVINYRDNYILDDYSYFVITGNNSDVGFISKSCPVEPNKTYMFSGEIFTHGSSCRISIGLQVEAQLNTFEGNELMLIEKQFANDWTYFEKSFNTTNNIVGVYVRIDYFAKTDTEQCFVRKLKLEYGDKATPWVPSLTDPYVNNVSIVSFNASDL